MPDAAVIVCLHRESDPPRLAVLPVPGRIGRDPDADLVLDDAKISHEHARAERWDGELRLVDADSFNGLWFDGVKVPSCPLQPGARIRLGPFYLDVLAVVAPEPAVIEVVGGEHLDRRVADLPCVAGLDAEGRLSMDADTLLDEPGVLLVDAEGFGRLVLDEEGMVEILRPDEGDETGVPLGALTLRKTGMRDFSVLPTDLAFDDGDVLVPRLSVSDLEAGFPPPELLADEVDDATIESLGLPVVRRRFLALGGGLGSFCWVDALRIHGVAASEIAAVGFEDRPYARYERLCLQSQIPPHERLRSNSESCPDNLWGFPGYAPREVLRSLLNLRMLKASRITWQILAEPDLSATYTPRAGDVFRSLDREARRIGWSRMLVQGRIRSLRKRRGGGFVATVSRMDDVEGERRLIVVGEHVHLALGYPGLRFLEDLRAYRERTRDFTRVVNAYEDHEHVYEGLAAAGGTVLLRGRGIVASRILQRIAEVRRKSGASIQVLHLMRSQRTRRERAGLASRPVENHWSFQPFNWPEAAWGGDLRRRMLRASETKRQGLYRQWGGTTTADRPDWKQIVRRGLQAGWYRIHFGEVAGLDGSGPRLQVGLSGGSSEAVDFAIDATGLVARASANPVIDDLIRAYDLPVNSQGGLVVDSGFRIEGLRGESGQAFAAGVTAFGNHYAPVDSFLGLQHAALRSVDALGVRRLSPERSLGQWLRWVRGARP